METVTLPYLTKRGKPVKSVVMVPTTEQPKKQPKKQNEAKIKLTDQEQLGCDSLNKALEQHGEMRAIAGGKMVKMVPKRQWMSTMRLVDKLEKGPSKRQAFWRVSKNLSTKGIVEFADNAFFLKQQKQ